jgi:hypothetical protein
LVKTANPLVLASLVLLAACAPYAFEDIVALIDEQAERSAARLAERLVG